MFLPTPGALVANRFRLRHAIGKGGMGQVWEAHDRELDSPCAVKFIVDHLAQDPEARQRIVREARAVAKLRTPHVVSILSVGEHEDAMYLAMELLEGETLASRLDRTGKLDRATTLALMEQVAEVLDKAHANGIVHRDLKPDNLWLMADPKPFIKLLDFGVAKTTLQVSTNQTASGALMGTPEYMSPEQASGDREVDHRSDLWALAIISTECLSGRRPFESTGLGELLNKIMNAPPPALQKLDPSLPAGLGAWWQRALARDPNQRFQSAADLLQALRLGLTAAPMAPLAPVLVDTDRGRWTAAPMPPRVPTLVTPTPLSAPPPTTAPIPLGNVEPAAARPEPGASVGPMTQTAQAAAPSPGAGRKLVLGTSISAFLLALVTLWVVVRSTRGVAEPIPTAAVPEPPRAPAAAAASPPAVAPPAPAAEPAPALPSAAPAAAPTPTEVAAPATAAATPGSAPQRPAPARKPPRRGSAPKTQTTQTQTAKLKARLGF